MEANLSADLYRLCEGLPYWAESAPAVCLHTPPAMSAEAPGSCTDPDWCVF